MHDWIKKAEIFLVILSLIATVALAIGDNYITGFLGAISGVNGFKIIISLVVWVITFLAGVFLEQMKIDQRQEARQLAMDQRLATQRQEMDQRHETRQRGLDQRHETRQRELVQELRTLSEPNRLFLSMEPEERKFVTQLLSYGQEVTRKFKQNDLIMQHKSRLLQNLKTEMESLSGGEFHTYFWTCNLLCTAVEGMIDEMIGLSPWCTTDKDWWESRVGQALLDLNRRLIKEGKTIHRIFLYNEPDRKELGKVLRKHSEAKVHVYTILTSELEQKGHFVHEAKAVIDHSIAFWATTRNYRRDPDQNHFSVNRDIIDNYYSQLHEIRESARPYNPDEWN